jgi:SAGA-associated factor 73
VVNQLDDSTRDTFATGRPLEDSPETSLCKHCKKSVLKSARKAHIEKCLADKKEAARKRKEAKERAARRKEEEGAAAEEGGEKEKGVKKGKKDKEKKEKEKEKKVDAEGDTAMGGEGEEDDEDAPVEASASPELVKKTPAGLKSAKKTAGKKNDDGEKKQGKKRKAEGDAEKMPKQKKKKDEPKAKIVKAKVPVDVERQCGVITPNGVPCARSLTCKSHSMGAKRAVPGRSLPYDMLLAAYQKKNQAKQQSTSPNHISPIFYDTH